MKKTIATLFCASLFFSLSSTEHRENLQTEHRKNLQNLNKHKNLLEKNNPLITTLYRLNFDSYNNNTETLKKEVDKRKKENGKSIVAFNCKEYTKESANIYKNMVNTYCMVLYYAKKYSLLLPYEIPIMTTAYGADPENRSFFPLKRYKNLIPFIPKLLNRYGSTLIRIKGISTKEIDATIIYTSSVSSLIDFNGFLQWPERLNIYFGVNLLKGKNVIKISLNDKKNIPFSLSKLKKKPFYNKTNESLDFCMVTPYYNFDIAFFSKKNYDCRFDFNSSIDGRDSVDFKFFSISNTFQYKGDLQLKIPFTTNSFSLPLSEDAIKREIGIIGQNYSFVESHLLRCPNPIKNKIIKESVTAKNLCCDELKNTFPTNKYKHAIFKTLKEICIQEVNPTES